MKQPNTAPTITPLAQDPRHAAATAALARLNAKKVQLVAEQKQLEVQLREPVGAEPANFGERVATLLAGGALHADIEAVRSRHLEVRQSLEAIGRTEALGRAELRAAESEAAAEARKAIEPAHRALCRRAADAIDELLALAAQEQALLAAASKAGHDITLQTRVLPLAPLDFDDLDSPTRRHVAELRRV